MPQIQADLFFAEKIIARTVFNFTYQLALRPSLPCVYPKRENGEFQDHGKIFHESRCAGGACFATFRHPHSGRGCGRWQVAGGTATIEIVRVL
jgi:hypothetical protein